ncbi:sugar transporter [Roseibium algae]|uniref:Sugar transporter n=1 Tax=Roseibium algae TaxID=3123038 RepID=A0ABU8TRA0_9HYPH
MLNRLFAVAFIAAVVGAPFAGLIGMVDAASPFSSANQQKSMCLISGVGCASGHVMIPAMGRM